ncbi:unnamed protein product [Aphanomyces euteiches]|uniref:Uncharacterized protein n=1 Tax=Aphanomyces euteiches TaxID=100861 RepID=A0A6G0W3Y4_9STRA|nr:hypothetical protein Ae201684_018870 [Aphanomyces euteiches]KAH9085287.1 hypothetical protein Ae201684P_004997 [Aphanomyces euteiches]KAH9095335.1 hypothetical protein Ae201684P_013450 [Aphanomyces euteiches]KAH9142671.1 hypothetical protein AeRB84_013273 [Aphanomyces euteiches]
MRAASIFFVYLVVLVFVFTEAKHHRQEDDQDQDPPQGEVVYVQRGKKAKRQMFPIGAVLGGIKVGTALYGLAKNYWGKRKLVEIDGE